MNLLIYCKILLLSLLLLVLNIKCTTIIVLAVIVRRLISIQNNLLEIPK
jgi:hypothetical protein